MQKERESIFIGKSKYFLCTMFWKILSLMTLSIITSWSNEMKSTKAELLHWNFWQYVKLLWPPNKEELPQLPGCRRSTVTHILRYTMSWDKVWDEKNASFIRYLRFMSAIRASSNFWYITWDAGLLCAITAAISKVRKPTVYSFLIAMVLHEALEERKGMTCTT